MKPAILLVDHGSRRPEANAQLDALADAVRARDPGRFVTVAHMELAEPDIAAGIAACVEAGANAVVVHPYFLGPGSHTSHDVPRLVEAACQQYPELSVRISAPLGLHAKIVDVVLERIDALG